MLLNGVPHGVPEVALGVSEGGAYEKGAAECSTREAKHSSDQTSKNEAGKVRDSLAVPEQYSRSKS